LESKCDIPILEVMEIHPKLREREGGREGERESNYNIL